MSDFRNALDAIQAELTPQPWDYTTPDGVTLTVIPAGLRADKGDAEVIVRITASRTLAAETGITTEDMPELLAAAELHLPWRPWTLLGDGLTAEPAKDGGMVLTVTELADSGDNREVTVSIHIPARQRLPLASALRRAYDVARGWED